MIACDVVKTTIIFYNSINSGNLLYTLLVSFVSMAVMMWCFDLLLEWHLLGSGPPHTTLFYGQPTKSTYVFPDTLYIDI
jgi:hypothetical protein